MVHHTLWCSTAKLNARRDVVLVTTRLSLEAIELTYDVRYFTDAIVCVRLLGCWRMDK